MTENNTKNLTDSLKIHLKIYNYNTNIRNIYINIIAIMGI